MKHFSESGLRPEILEAVAKLGFDTPTPVQAQTLPLLEQPSSDLIALAQTGTGKTAAFGLPLLHRIDPASKDVQALVLCPTRELALQIVNDLKDYSRYMDEVTITAVYGGAPMHVQIKALRKGTQIVVGTPGRVLDMLSRGELRLERLSWFVLDEADEMLNMGFKDDLEAIFQAMPKEKSTWLFSATMPPRVESMAGKYMNKPLKVTVGKRNEGAANIAHVYYMVQARDRFEALSRIVAATEDMYGVVFCRTRSETTDVASKLSRKGYRAEAINGDLSQQQRDKVMGAFRKGQVRLLVATDVAARGLDVEELTHVVNFNLPDDPEVYVHRSGRTGRAGKSGVCISIIHSREQGRIRDLERMTGKKFERREVPLLSDIAKYNVLARADEMLAMEGHLGKMGSIPAEVALKFEHLSREDVIEQWIKWAFAQQASQEAGMPDDINAKSTGKSGSTREPRVYGKEKFGSERKPRTGRDEDGAFTEVQINIGKEQYLRPNKIMGIINELTGNPSINFGRIDIFDNKTFVGVESAHAREVAAALDGLQFGSTQLRAQIGKGSGRGAEKGGSFQKKGAGKFKGRFDKNKGAPNKFKKRR